MKAIKATWKNGRIVPDERVDWPEGCRLLVEPLPDRETLGIREEDWPTDPEGIAKHLARMEQIKPLLMTEEERAKWQAALKEHKEWEKANFEKWAKELEDLFR